MDLLKQIEEKNNEAAKQFIDNINNMFYDALSKKGVDISNPLTLAETIKTRCSCIDDQEKKERIYSLDGEPFLLHNYNVTYDTGYINDGFVKGQICIKSKGGYFIYL